MLHFLELFIVFRTLHEQTKLNLDNQTMASSINYEVKKNPLPVLYVPSLNIAWS